MHFGPPEHTQGITQLWTHDKHPQNNCRETKTPIDYNNNKKVEFFCW